MNEKQISALSSLMEQFREESDKEEREICKIQLLAYLGGCIDGITNENPLPKP